MDFFWECALGELWNRSENHGRRKLSCMALFLFFPHVLGQKTKTNRKVGFVVFLFFHVFDQKTKTGRKVSSVVFAVFFPCVLLFS